LKIMTLMASMKCMRAMNVRKLKIHTATPFLPKFFPRYNIVLCSNI